MTSGTGAAGKKRILFSNEGGGTRAAHPPDSRWLFYVNGSENFPLKK